MNDKNWEMITVRSGVKRRLVEYKHKMFNTDKVAFSTVIEKLLDNQD